jgi:hypothetical protein
MAPSTPVRRASGKRKAPASPDSSSDSNDTSQPPTVTKRQRRNSTITTGSGPHSERNAMSDEEEKEEAGAVVALTDEERQYEGAKRLYDRAVIRLSEADEALEQWKGNHAGYGPLHAELQALEKRVNDTDQALQNADQRLQNARQRLKDARAAAGMSLSRKLWTDLSAYSYLSVIFRLYWRIQIAQYKKAHSLHYYNHEMER